MRSDLSDDAFARLAEVGSTRKGSSFAKNAASGPECVVTGGLGTIAVEHDGKTYFVCCGGCRDLFNEDPEGVLADYRERKAAERARSNRADCTVVCTCWSPPLAHALMPLGAVAASVDFGADASISTSANATAARGSISTRGSIGERHFAVARKPGERGRQHHQRREQAASDAERQHAAQALQALMRGDHQRAVAHQRGQRIDQHGHGRAGRHAIGALRFRGTRAGCARRSRRPGP